MTPNQFILLAILAMAVSFSSYQTSQEKHKPLHSRKVHNTNQEIGWFIGSFIIYFSGLLMLWGVSILFVTAYNALGGS